VRSSSSLSVVLMTLMATTCPLLRSSALYTLPYAPRPDSSSSGQKHALQLPG
jgi:hypothetical protein